MIRRQGFGAVLAAVVFTAAACGGDDSTTSDTGAAASDGDRPTVVVTTNVLGDVVEALVGDAVDVVVIMPMGADPHDFQASAQDAARIGDADAIVVNGAGFEEGLLDVVEAAEADGVPVFEAVDAIATLEFDGHGDDEHGDDEHGDDEHGDDEHGDDEHGDDEHGDDEHGDDEHGDDEHGHEHEGVDPHFFTDPARMADAAEALVDFLVDLPDTGIDADELREAADAYLDELATLDAEVDEILAAVPDDRRALLTNHEVFGYFADRYGFEVVGVVVPGGGTGDATSAAELLDLVEVIEAEGVPAIFTDTSSSDDLARTLAEEADGVAVVELFTESLGEKGSGGETYLDMVRTNATRIADALTS